MMKHVLLLPFALITALLPFSADAAPVRWILQDVIFSDGATVEGSFVFDAETGIFNNIDVVTSAGSAWLFGQGDVFVPVPERRYDRVSVRVLVGPTQEIVYLDDAAQDAQAEGIGIVELAFRSPLTSDGGAVALVGTDGPQGPSGFAGEISCPAPLEYPSCIEDIRVRLVESGTVVSYPPVQPVPTLTFWGLALLAVMFAMIGAAWNFRIQSES